MMSFKKVAIILLLLALFGLLPYFGTPYMVVLFGNIFMYVVLTLSWVMFSGPTGYISLASAAFFGAGIYTAAVLSFKLPVIMIVLMGATVGFLLALLIGVITLRLRGIYFAMFTFGFVELLLYFVLWYETNIKGTTGRIVFTLGNVTVYYIMYILSIILLLVMYILNKSKYGMALKSIGDNEIASEHSGVNVTRIKILVYALSAAFVGACGSIMATRLTYIDPKIAFNPLYSFIPIFMAIFGGMREIYGPIIGSFIFSYLQEVLTTKIPYYYMLLFGLLMIFIIAYMPEGLIGLLRINLIKRNRS
jgi:branched-chain amino acid transport system permease protein